MVVAYRDLSGNSPTNHLLDRATMHSAPSVSFGDAITDCATVDQEFQRMARAIYIGVTGGNDLEVVDWRGNSEIFIGLVAGQTLDVQASGTRAAGTDVTTIIPLY